MKTRIVKLSAGSGAGEPGSIQATKTSFVMSARAQNDGPGDRSPARHGQVAGNIGSGEHFRTGQVVTLLVEANGLFGDGLKRILEGTAYSPVLSVANLDDVRPLLGAGRAALLLILDPGKDCWETCRQVRAFLGRNPSARIVMFVERYDLQQMLVAFDAGMAACLTKATSREALVKMLDLVMLGETCVPATVLTELREPSYLRSHDRRKGLSTRERAVLECLTEGASNKVIARKLDITEATVKVHIKSILRKVQAKNRTQAALWASTHILTKRS